MTDPFSDRYWIEEFQVTKADLDRIAAHIRETSWAHDLTTWAVVTQFHPPDIAPADQKSKVACG